MTNFNEVWSRHLEEAELEVTNFDSQGELNQNIWQDRELRREVASALVKIAMDFYDSLGLDEDFEDIRLTGSNAGYFWTDLSDIDLHIILDFSKFGDNADLIQELISLKRSQWNMRHKILIRGQEVEVYVQDENEPHYTVGEYSLLRREWTQEPIKDIKSIDYRLVRVKSEAFADEIDALKDLFMQKEYDQAYKHAKTLKSKLQKMRHAGLGSKGVFSLENLAFKVLRNNNYIDRLMSLLNLSYDKKMSINQQ